MWKYKYEADTNVNSGTDDGFLEDLLGEEVGLADSLPLDARAELDRLHELAAEFSRLTAAAGAQKGQTADEDDDSNGEDMTREINDIVSQAVEAASSPKHAEAASAATVGGDASVAPSSTAAVGDVGDVADVENEEGPDLALPSVPTDAPSPTGPQSAGSPAPMTGNFEDDMARRMAALRSFRPSLGAQDQEEEDSNPLGLPSVPTFKPSEGNKPKPGPAGRAGFTDEDMQTWCVACLEDGTLICPECGDEVYCSQCWFDMHKGPAAGFEERSHRAQQFNKDQRKKRVALGA
ncbi:unnamed protein product [Parascedosporium putredinis]|uniref:Uncharacterized protein n=1 Tax=Parascedosporium putredinis TaxID=1442378 RepID=A0A9P1H9T8_9PEZI|nr:unnamed protein product [Parascedosporium putredinis]CAI8002163.1 unnamed protein product [Parascedosporium putredinis]